MGRGGEGVCAGSFIIASDRNEFRNGCSIHTTLSDRGVLKRVCCLTAKPHVSEVEKSAKATRLWKTLKLLEHISLCSVCIRLL